MRAIIVLFISLFLSVSASAASKRPPNLQISTEGTSANIFWDTVLWADSYNLYYAPYPIASPVNKLAVNGTKVSGEIPAGSSFYVAVTATKTNAEGVTEESNFSNIVTFSIKEINSSDSSATATEVLASSIPIVIAGTYNQLKDDGKKLLESVITLNFNTNAANLEAAQQAWRNARQSWEQTEGFLFGPVDTMGVDPAIDSWPVNKVDLDAVLNSGNVLTANFVGNLDDTLKGFHTIEYLLFGGANDLTADKLNVRQKQYLVAAADNLSQQTTKLADAWDPGIGNYTANFKTFGTTGSLYASTNAAVQELLQAMAGIADEVGNGKMSDPYSEKNTTLVESQFSYNSITDFANNIRGIENIYIGRWLSNDGPGVNDLVRQKNSALDIKVRAAITSAIDAINGIPYPFRNSISTEDGRAKIAIAITKVGELQALIEGDLTAALK